MSAAPEVRGFTASHGRGRRARCVLEQVFAQMREFRPESPPALPVVDLNDMYFSQGRLLIGQNAQHHPGVWPHSPP